MSIYFVLFIGIIAVSFASILIKLCDAPALVIASYRLGLSSFFFITLAGIKKKNPLVLFNRRDFYYAALSGLFLCLHFAAWITSLKYTSVANSVVLVSTAPIFVTIGSFIFLKEKSTRLLVMGILISILGVIMLTTQNLSMTNNHLLGMALAITGAVGYAGYILLGRKLRIRYDILSYVSVVYFTAAVLLILMTSILEYSFFSYNFKIYVFLILIAFIPQVIGHTSFNWALKFVSASFIAVVALGEPIGAIILAYFILGEKITAIQALGGILILSGIVLAIRGESGQRM